MCNVGKVTTKHPCEFVFTQAAKFLHVISSITSNTKKRPIISSISTKAQLYNKEIGVMRRMVKIGFPCDTLVLCPLCHDGLYIWSRDYTFGHETVLSL
jgi:hypothetical protein